MQPTTPPPAAYLPAASRLHTPQPERPYYIEAPDYRRTSSGILVLHLLCHALNLSGHEAYLTTSKINPRLRTPPLTPEIRKKHQDAGLEPIAIYPEVVFGNPLRARSVVRYILNHPGRIAGPKTFAETDFILAFGKRLLQKGRGEYTLYIPPTNVAIFNNLDNPDDQQRQGILLYTGRYPEGLEERPDLAEKATLITYTWPESHEELAALFRRSELLYAFEPSNVSLEAALCGCPTVFLRSPYYDGAPLAETELGRWGFAYDDTPEDIAFARATVGQMWDSYLKTEATFWKKLAEFVEVSQQLPLVEPDDDLGPIIGSGRLSETYLTWRERKSLQEIDGQLLGERMTGQWTSQPTIEVFVDPRADEETLLADTFDSLVSQWYPHWGLTLLADFPALDPSLTELEQIHWRVRDPAAAIDDEMAAILATCRSEWLLLLEPGVTLEAHALAFFADTINVNPQAQLIYCDEDVHDPEGALSAPRFKPDLNIELLRGMYYLGPALLVRRKAIKAVGGWRHLGSATFYDLALRLLDHFGPRSLVHLNEILAHTPSHHLRQIDASAEHEAVRRHLARRQISATVDQGLLQGTQHLRYHAQAQPLVSIIIPTRDQPGYLEHCVESLLAETTYPNFELVLVDHDTTDPDALDYLAKLDARPELQGRVQLTRTDGPFNYARLLNLGAEIARGEHLLFLDNDTQIVMPEWLSDLLAIQLQTGAALVAPRLSRASGEHTLVETGPRLLGINGLAVGMAGEKTNILEPGYCGRLQVAQEVSAVAGSCVLIQRRAFDACGGMDAEHTPIYESTLDLCLRLRAAGHKLIWTPAVNVAHHGAITRQRLENDAVERARLTATAIAERNHLWRTQLPALANDPNYSRHLSLTEAFAIEPYAVIDWDLRFHERLRVLGLPLTSGSGEYRMTSPFRALQAAGVAQTCIVHPMAMRKQRVLNPIELARAAPDVLMLQQAIDDVQIGQLKLYREYNPEIFITYAVDDVLGNLPRKHYLYNFQAREGRYRLREGLAHCDRLIASTEPIADYCRKMIDDIVVVPNRLERKVWVGHESLRGTGQKPRVGWAGAQQHLGDLELIKEVVEALKDEVEWVFMGMCPDVLRPYVAEEHPFVAYSKYPAKLASLNLDLAIAPLEQHLFNEGKSNLRLLEYGIMGWPVVCTDIYPYRTNGAPVKRVENVAQAWLAAIRERINDLEATYREGDALREWVLQHYILEDHLDEWLQAVTPR